MLRPALTVVASLALLTLACRSIDAPAPRTPVPTPEVTRTAVPREPTSTPAARATREPIPVTVEEAVPFAALEGEPISGARLMDLLTSSGHELIEVQSPFIGGIPFCASVGGELTDDFVLKPGFRTPVIAVGNADASVVLAFVFYENEMLRSADWALDPDGSAHLIEDGACATWMTGQSTFLRNSMFEAFFPFGGWLESSAIGTGNVIAVFTDVVIGGNELGGNGLDPELRAEVERLIRGLHEE